MSKNVAKTIKWVSLLLLFDGFDVFEPRGAVTNSW